MQVEISKKLFLLRNSFLFDIFQSDMSKKYTTTEAGERLNLSGARIRQLILTGQIKAEKIGQLNVIDEKELKRFEQLDRQPGRPTKGVKNIIRGKNK